MMKNLRRSRLLMMLLMGIVAAGATTAVAQTTQTSPDPQPPQEPLPQPRTIPRSPTERGVPGRPSVAPIPPARPAIAPGRIPGRLQNTIRGLDVGRANLRDALDSRRKAATSATRPQAASSIRQKLEAMRRNREAVYSAITRRLDRLEVILPPRAEPGPGPTSVPPLLPGTPKDASSQSSAVASESGTTGGPPVGPDSPAGQEDEIEVPNIPDAPVTPDAEAVTESAIDRLSLADNLFASGDMENALRLYLELSAEADQVDAGDRVWIDYQVACTSRRLKKYEQARKFYRKVVSTKSTGVYSKLAKWWLEAMQRKEGYETRHAEIRLELDLK